MIAIAKPVNSDRGLLVLFVGGPFDGKLRRLKYLSPTFHVPEVFPIPVYRSGGVDESPFARAIEYRCWHFQASGRDFYIYSTEDFGPARIMEVLISSYANDVRG